MNVNQIINEDEVLVDFYAEWCGPCKALAPILDEVVNEKKIKVLKVNVSEEPDLARYYNINSIPSLLLFKKGVLINKHIGFIEKDKLIEFLEN